MHSPAKTFLGWLLAAGLAGGSVTAGVAPSYEVFGQRYHVLDSSAGYVERGVASWYGPGFHGNPTASGEQFDMFALTAAHKTLPIATTAKVTNLRNGRSVVVRINDRGPFVGRRIIDLSYAAGQALGLVGAGTGLVEVRALGRVPEPTPPFVQVGAYSRPANAERMRKRLEGSGFGSVFVHERSVGGRRLHAVRLQITDSAAYESVVERLRAIGIAVARLPLEPALIASRHDKRSALTESP